MTTPQTYRSKPVEIQAMQWDGTWDSYLKLGGWAKSAVEWRAAQETVISVNADTGETITVPLGEAALPTRVKLYVAANDAWLTLGPGEWVIRDDHGYYPCKPDIFAAKYALVP